MNLEQISRKEQMELKDYIKVLIKNIWLIVLTVVLVGVLAYVFSSQKKTTYNGYKTISVSKNEGAIPDANYFQYEGFYAASSANLQAKGLSSWLGSASSVAQIYTNTGEIVPEITTKNLKTLITVNNDPDSNVVSITMTDISKDDLQKRLDAIGDLGKTYFSSLSGGEQFNLKISDNSITTQSPSKTMNLAAGLLGGLLIGIVIAFAKEYFTS